MNKVKIKFVKTEKTSKENQYIKNLLKK